MRLIHWELHTLGASYTGSFVQRSLTLGPVTSVEPVRGTSALVVPQRSRANGSPTFGAPPRSVRMLRFEVVTVPTLVPRWSPLQAKEKPPFFFKKNKLCYTVSQTHDILNLFRTYTETNPCSRKCGVNMLNTNFYKSTLRERIQGKKLPAQNRELPLTHHNFTNDVLRG